VLKQRVITALIAVAALLLVVFVLPAAAAQAIIALVILAGAWEWSGFLGSDSKSLRMAYVALIAVLMGFVTWQAPQINGLLFQVALAWWICALVWTLFYPTPIPALVRCTCPLGRRRPGAAAAL
jgi:phosphatidate cytidylyltransferase